LVLIMAALLVGCAKPPTQEMDAAKVAMDGAIAAGAEKYAKDGLKSLNDSWAAAQDEVKKQEGKLFEVRQRESDDRESPPTPPPEDRDRAEEGAGQDGGQQATTAATPPSLGEGPSRQAPRAKGARPTSRPEADLAGIEGSLAEVTTLITSEEYFAATDKAKAISAKAADISAQVQAAIDKAPKGRKK
jgi:hypothetical protein